VHILTMVIPIIRGVSRCVYLGIVELSTIDHCYGYLVYAFMDSVYVVLRIEMRVQRIDANSALH
jgi:hypothetical protein